MQFIPDKFMHTIFFGKAINQIIFMLPYPL